MHQLKSTANISGAIVITPRRDIHICISGKLRAIKPFVINLCLYKAPISFNVQQGNFIGKEDACDSRNLSHFTQIIIENH